MKRFFTIILAAAAAIASLSAQEHTSTEVHDLKLNSGFDITCRLSSRWRLGWAEEIYLKNDMRERDRYYSRVTLTYSLSERIRIAPMLLLVNIRNTTSPEDQLVFDLNFYYTRRLGRWSFTLRETPRLKYSAVVERSPRRANPELLLRTHLATSYTLTHRISAFANAEIFNMLNAPRVIDNLYLQRLRTNVGLKYAFDARNAISLYWRHDHTVSKQITLAADGTLEHVNSHHSVNNMAGVFYYFSF